MQPAVSANGTLTYTPAANANGIATVTVQLHDNGGTANGGVDTSAAQTFTISVTAVNDAPSFIKGANQTVLEDAGARTVTGWATAISAGAANEAGQALNFIVSNNNNALFSAQPAIARERHADLHAGRERQRHRHRHRADCTTTAARPTAASTPARRRRSPSP